MGRENNKSIAKNIITYKNPVKNGPLPFPSAKTPILLDNPVVKNKRGNKNFKIKFIAHIFNLDFL
ncbi:hypothetical protein EN5CB1_15290 [Tepidimicrobium xylanilyticum]|nr:hypothetical protein EN5CB1_15290 [Tepidimicrobium xylanilyticum]